MIWSSSSGRIELEIKKADAETCHHSGQCDEDVARLVATPYVAEQLSALDPNLIRAELKEYGAWSPEELLNHDENLNRLVWIAACDLAEFGDE